LGQAAGSKSSLSTAIALIGITAFVSLMISHYYLVNGDDLLEIWGDKASGLGTLLHTQRTFPLEIDPLLYHLLTFVEISLWGLKPVLLRLPSLFGFLLMQLCLFVFVRRIASSRTALVALLFPALSATFTYTLYIRPYGFLLGLFALASLSWQTAIRYERHRIYWLISLALTIALAINTHYYAVLLLVPLCFAELVRSWQNRRLDFPMLSALFAGTMGTLFILPFLKGASEFRSNYVKGGVSYHTVLQSYNSILLGAATYSIFANHLLAIALLLCAAFVFWSCIVQIRTGQIAMHLPEFIFLLTLAGLPVFAFLIGHFVTHAMEPRYALGAIVGISVLSAISISPSLRLPKLGAGILLILVAAFTWRSFQQVRAAKTSRDMQLASMVLAPAIKAAIMNTPSQLLYVQDVDAFGFAQFHEGDRNVLSHMALVYSATQEMKWNHTETGTRIVTHLKRVETYNISPYEHSTAQPGRYIFLINQGGWNWIEDALAARHARVTPIGTALGLKVVSVEFD